MSNDNTRAAFEAWFSNEGAHPAAVERSGNGYKLASAHAAWGAWQACAAALAAPAPQPELLPAKEGQPTTLTITGPVPEAGHWYSPETVREILSHSVQQRKPLDEHQIRMLPILPTHGIADVVRIVEAAHGITAAPVAAQEAP